MERILFFASLLIGGLVWLLASLRPATSRLVSAVGPAEVLSPWKTPLGIVALTLPPLGFLISLPTSAPLFSAGHGLGSGFLIGGIAALLAAVSLFRQRGSGDIAGSFGIACAAAVFPPLFLRASLIDALLGLAIGWLAVTFPLYLAVQSEYGSEADSNTSQALAAGAGFAAALCGVAALGTWRAEMTPALARTTWSAIALVFGAVGALVALAVRFALPRDAASDTAKAAGKALVPALIFAVLGGVMLKLFSVKIAPEPRLFLVGLAGLLVWPAASWLLRDADTRDSARNPRSSLGVPPLAVLLVAAGFVASYQMLQGFGAGVYVLALWLSAAMSPRRLGAEISLLLFATALVLYRVFATRFNDDLRGVTLTDQYALFGLIFGALLPGIMASLVGRRSAHGIGGVLTLVLAGTLALIAPAAIILLFGGKCALALLLGLGLGSVQILRNSNGEVPAFSQLPGLFTLAVALALDQFTGKILPLTEMTRLHKVQLLGWLIAGVVAALVLAEMTARSRRDSDNGEAQ
jgi:hypothetical protein